MRTLRVLAKLLAYPDMETKTNVPRLRDILAEENVVPVKQRASLIPLFEALESGDLLDLQESYVTLFDLGRGLSLHLFEHVYGDSRERGQAMVELAKRYHACGLAIAGNELPDFLPLILEYASVAPPEDARKQLAEIAHIVDAIAARLEKRGSPYAAVLAALAAISGKRLFSTADLVTVDEPDSRDAMDRAWEEAAVTFGPENAPGDGCGRAAAIVSRFDSRA